MKRNRWQFWIDVGGTFTDCLALDSTGNEYFRKLLSSGITKGLATVSSNSATDEKLRGYCDDFWVGGNFILRDKTGWACFQSSIKRFDRESGTIVFNTPCGSIGSTNSFFYEIESNLPAAVLAIHKITGKPITKPLDAGDVYLGTTKGTNALLTRSGAKTGLVTSTGFKDFLTIGDQTRPHLFELTIKKPTPLFEESIEIDERVLFDGTIERIPNVSQIRLQLQELKNNGIESVAICLMHGYKFPKHEQLVGKIARDLGFDEVRLSSDVAPLVKLIPRGHTTVLDAYLNPVLGKYLDEIQTRLGPDSKLQLLTSAGNLTRRTQFSGKDSVLSGPAGGAVGAARIAQQIGFDQSIAFDMGGTSTDVSRFDGDFEIEFETTKAGIPIMTPVMKIETVAAGGGSICDFDGTRMTVGPDSAGAHPGPACYGAGGPLTITDINLFLSRLNVDRFPFPLDRNATESKLRSLTKKINQTPHAKTELEVAEGFLRIANHSMASAIRTVSVARGYDPKNHLLVSFGGAGGQHCCGVAENLGISQILVHPKSSILSAYGIKLADHSYSSARSIGLELNDTSIQNADEAFRAMTIKLSKQFEDVNIPLDSVTIERSLDLRYTGTDNTINTDSGPIDELKTAFAQKHKRLFGYTHNRQIEIVAARAKATLRGQRLSEYSIPSQTATIVAAESVKIYSKGQLLEGGRFEWDQVPIAAKISGPAIVYDSTTSTIVDVGWSAVVLANRQLLITRNAEQHSRNEQSEPASDVKTADPVELELFNSSFKTIAEQMGVVLKNTSVSVNVKERLDFSCALFSSAGDLVVNAPHIPVHLGAMSETVKAIIRLNPKIRQDDVFVTNDPYEGGSHLPDITVLTPVFFDERIQFWVASRAHHAELGGTSPGSMPANATRLGEEGVLIQNFKSIDAGNERFSELRELLSASDFPSRNPDENIADMNAQVAANQSGVTGLAELVTTHSIEKVLAYMHHIRIAAESKIRDLIRSLEKTEYSFSDSMDDGTKISVKILNHGESLEIDFHGSDPAHSGNLNTNKAIVASAITYVLRCLIQQDIPLNGGVLNPITIVLPECFLCPQPSKNRNSSPAVVGGNVETSQRIVDVLLGAFGVAAASQGTMNNWLVGDNSFGYYETVGGGSGATAMGVGADAVHCHMSNTRLTDPEILETRYPMVLRKFEVRQASGGDGQFRGGNGMIREIEFASPLTLSILTSRRTSQPFGMAAGETGKPGANILYRADGSKESLPSQCERTVALGDRLQLKTPGGGGYGKPN